MARIRPFVEMAQQARVAGSPDRALQLLMNIALRCFWANPDHETRLLVAEAAESLPVPKSHPMLIQILACAAPIEYGAVVIDRLAHLPADAADPLSSSALGFAATAVGAFHPALNWLSHTVAVLRAQGGTWWRGLSREEHEKRDVFLS